MSQPSVPSSVPQIVPNRIAPTGDYANGTSSYWVPTASGGGGGGGGVSNPLTATLACAGNNITGAGTLQSANLNVTNTAQMNAAQVLPVTNNDGVLTISSENSGVQINYQLRTAGSTQGGFTAGGFYINGPSGNLIACPGDFSNPVLFPGYVSTPTLTAGTITTNNVSAQSVTTNGVLANGNGVFNYPVTFNSTVNFAYPPASSGLTPRTTLLYSVTLPLPQTIPTPTGQIQGQAFTAPATGVYMIQWTLQYSPGNTTAGNADAFNCVIYQTDQGTNVPKARASIPVLGLTPTVAYPSWTSMTVIDTLIAGENYTPQSLIYNRSGTLATTLVWNLEINITSLC
jgi:hypothetical protein